MNIQCSLLARALRSAVFALLVAVAPWDHAATLWQGPNTNFTQSSAVTKDVLIPGAVSLKRNGSHWLYNPDGGDTTFGTLTPTDTEWAFGSLANFATLKYQTFDSLRNGDLSDVLLHNKPMVVHLIKEDIYLSLMFTQWPRGGGFFAYTRSTPSASAPPPTVSITGPADGSVFSAPANVTIVAAAGVSSGSVTNVEFFAGSTSLGAAQAAPFGISAANLAAGSYALTAVATAGGISATSTPVNITVVSPVAISLGSPKIVRGEFSFAFTANSGLSYVIQSSSNLVAWLPIATNAAAADSVHFSDAALPNGALFYRVKLAGNP